MTTLEEAVDELEGRIEESLSLVVARGSGEAFEPHKLHLAAEAADGLRELCRSALDETRSRTEVPYTPTAELSDGEAFVISDGETLGEIEDLISLGTSASTLPHEAPADLDGKIQLYAIVVGDSKRSTFLRKVDPVLRPSGGRMFAIGGDRLRRVEEPAFSFRPGFDLILGDTWALVLNQSGFERMFRDLGLIDRHIESWVGGITEHLSMAEESIADLTRAATADSRMWRRLREIKSRGHLKGLSIERVAAYAEAVHIDPDDVIRDGQLYFDPDPTKRFSFLHLLNEDIYEGFFTKETYEVQRKARP